MKKRRWMLALLLGLWLGAASWAGAPVCAGQYGDGPAQAYDGHYESQTIWDMIPSAFVGMACIMAMLIVMQLSQNPREVNAARYVPEDGFKLTRQRDVFVNSTVERFEIKDNK